MEKNRLMSKTKLKVDSRLTWHETIIIKVNINCWSNNVWQIHRLSGSVPAHINLWSVPAPPFILQTFVIKIDDFSRVNHYNSCDTEKHISKTGIHDSVQ